MAFYECVKSGRGLERVLVGTVTSFAQKYTFDCTFIDGYNKLTADNFGITPTSFYYEWTNSAGEGSNIITSGMTYDPITGILTITNTGNLQPRSNYLRYNVYCFYYPKSSGATPAYSFDNPRVEASGTASAGNIQWVGSFGGGFSVNLKPEDTTISVTASMNNIKIYIDGVQQEDLNGTKEYTLSENSTFSASTSFNTSGDKTLTYSYKIW